MSVPHLLIVAGARPQFIKAAAIVRALLGPFAGRFRWTLLHSGQHTDEAMSGVFFSELGMPLPHVQLPPASWDRDRRLPAMMEGIEGAILADRPDAVIVFGDTDTTLAGALAAVRQRVRLAHVEAGLRSGIGSMPEEVNRVITDHGSSWLFCPTGSAVKNLSREGVQHASGGTPGLRRPVVLQCGDVMLDNARWAATSGVSNSAVAATYGLRPGGYVLATVHRAENTDRDDRLLGIMEELRAIPARTGMPVLMPLHPRTRDRLARLWSLRGIEAAHGPGLHIVSPVGYREILALVQGARVVVTDSGGLQKEAAFLGRPVVVLRGTTEWTELVEQGIVHLAGDERGGVVNALSMMAERSWEPVVGPYGDGHAAERILEALHAGLA